MRIFFLGIMSFLFSFRLNYLSIKYLMEESGFCYFLQFFFVSFLFLLLFPYFFIFQCCDLFLLLPFSQITYFFNFFVFLFFWLEVIVFYIKLYSKTLLLDHHVFNYHEQGNVFLLKFAKMICPRSKVARQFSIYNVVDLEKQTEKN